MHEIIHCKGKISSTWQVIEDMIPSKKNKSNTYFFDNLKDKAKEFNHFFSGVGETTYNRSQELLKAHPDSAVPCNDSNNDPCHLFRPESVDTNTVILTIKHLNKTRSVVSDGISLRFLQDALCVIASYLTCIINTFLVTGTFPTQRKHALVVPLFKSADTSVVNRQLQTHMFATHCFKDTRENSCYPTFMLFRKQTPF